MIEKLGPYRIKGELGRGAGGVVYHGIDPETGQEVALKALAMSGVDPVRDQTLMERMRREAESTSILKHPNIVLVYGLEQDQGHVYLAMELVRGRTLEQALRENEKFSRQRVAQIVSETASALDFAHQANMVHRDVKPANLMLTENGGVKVMDFGAVKMLDRKDAMDLTRVGMVVGSPHYMSPEQIRGIGVDGRSDQFSLAVIAYQLLGGKLPFTAESLAAVLYLIADENHAPLTTLDRELPAAIDPVFQRALAKKPAGRYSTCAEFAADLSAAVAGKPAKKKKRWWMLWQSARVK